MSDWTQPICNICWWEREGDRVPTRLIEPDEERCCLCCAPHRSGIYMRVDPDTVPYPTRRQSS